MSREGTLRCVRNNCKRWWTERKYVMWVVSITLPLTLAPSIRYMKECVCVQDGVIICANIKSRMDLLPSQRWCGQQWTDVHSLTPPSLFQRETLAASTRDDSEGWERRMRRMRARWITASMIIWKWDYVCVFVLLYLVSSMSFFNINREHPRHCCCCCPLPAIFRIDVHHSVCIAGEGGSGDAAHIENQRHACREGNEIIWTWGGRKEGSMTRGNHEVCVGIDVRWYMQYVSVWMWHDIIINYTWRHVRSENVVTKQRSFLSDCDYVFGCWDGREHVRKDRSRGRVSDSITNMPVHPTWSTSHLVHVDQALLVVADTEHLCNALGIDAMSLWYIPM